MYYICFVFIYKNISYFNTAFMNCKISRRLYLDRDIFFPFLNGLHSGFGTEPFYDLKWHTSGLCAIVSMVPKTVLGYLTPTHTLSYLVIPFLRTLCTHPCTHRPPCILQSFPISKPPVLILFCVFCSSLLPHSPMRSH